MGLLNLNYLKTLLAVKEYGNFSAAARQIGITQPAVSLQIQALEEDFATQLVIRDARTCELTPAGNALLAFGTDVFERLRQTRILIDQMTGEVSGLVRLGASNIPGEYILPNYLANFMKLHPLVRFDLEIGDSDQILSWLDNKQIDLGIVGQRVADSKYEYDHVADDELLIAVPQDHPWAGREIAPAELLDYPFVGREFGSGTRSGYEKALNQVGIGAESLHTVFSGGSTSSVLTAVLAGIGFTICSTWALQSGVALGQLATARIAGLTMQRGFYMVTLPNQFRTLATEELLVYLRNR